MTVMALPPDLYVLQPQQSSRINRFCKNFRCLAHACMLGLGALLLTGAARACPDLTSFYAAGQADWPAAEVRLLGIMGECLDNAEYFALLGAAQMNNGNVGESLESLERALLLDPGNGAAQIDYAQALFLQGELFAALAMNGQLLQRPDLPTSLQPALRQRQERWQQLTRQRTLQLDVLAGYDNNLNSAPEPGQITLTLSGEPVVLELNPEFKPRSGPYANFRLGGRFRQLAPSHQHNWLIEARGRSSEDKESDLLQLDTRYAFVRPDRLHSWQLEAGMSHLFFGGSPLYTATELGGRYLPRGGNRCQPFYSLEMQHQFFHDQTRLNALESKAALGRYCPFNGGLGPQQLGFELGLLNNLSLKDGRAGGDRLGWQANLNWQLRLPRGELLSQLSHTRLRDSKAYSPLLANGARRWLERSYLLVQYRRPLGPATRLLINLFHQNQSSNIELFRSIDTTFEVGLSLTF